MWRRALLMFEVRICAEKMSPLPWKLAMASEKICVAEVALAFALLIS